MIKGLLKKDLYNLSSYKTSLILIIVFCSIAIVGTEAINWGAIIICTITGMISLATFNYDEISKANRYILTLPVTRKEIVMEKYILAIGATILGGILGFLLTILIANVMKYIRPEDVFNINYKSLFTTTIGGMFGISLIQSIQIPSIYKWGAEKGRIQMFVLLFIIIVIGSGLGILLVKSNLNMDVKMLNNLFNKLGIVILMVAMLTFYYISYKISLKIYKNKEE